MANPMVRQTDLPLEERGRLRVRADLKVEGDAGVILDAWGAGDVAAVPDLTGNGVGGYCVPNAQHAVRHGKLVAKNLVSELRGEGTVDYFHKSIGAVAGLGVGWGAYQNGKLAITGVIGWIMHRGYHGLAIPTWERKIFVFANWILHFFLGRDIVPLPRTVEPRAAFAEFASRPKAPPIETPPAKSPLKSPAKV
jgi:NADH dehydrogenase